MISKFLKNIYKNILLFTYKNCSNNTYCLKLKLTFSKLQIFKAEQVNEIFN